MLGAMRGKHTYQLLMVTIFSLVLTLILSLQVSAVDDVDNSITLTFIDGVTLEVDVSTIVEEITLPANGETYTYSEIQSNSINDLETMGSIKYAIKDLVRDQLELSFPNAQITSLQKLPTYSSPTFIDSYRIQLTSAHFQLNESVDSTDLINGLYDCGAHIDYLFPLHSDVGWNSTYVFELPSHITYKITTGDVHQNTITWKVKTFGEMNIKEAEMTLYTRTQHILLHSIHQ